MDEMRQEAPSTGKSNRSLPLQARLVASVVVALASGLSTESLATAITVPTGLNPGDQYRLIFVSSTTHDATSSSIGDYNDFGA
jgi:hypothetical protein